VQKRYHEGEEKKRENTPRKKLTNTGIRNLQDFAKKLLGGRKVSKGGEVREGRILGKGLNSPVKGPTRNKTKKTRDCRNSKEAFAGYKGNETINLKKRG